MMSEGGVPFADDQAADVDEWRFLAEGGSAHYECPHLQIEVDGFDVAMADVEVLGVNSDGTVPLRMRVEGPDEDAVGALVTLSPDRADALAAALADQADYARETGPKTEAESDPDA